MAIKVVYLTSLAALPTWTVPSDFTNSNTIECVGGGGAGGPGSVSCASGGGGGGYSKISNLSLVPGASVTYQVGSGGPAGGGNGGDTWFNATTFAAASVAAKGGGSGSSGAFLSCTVTQPGGQGGQASSGIGTTKHSGGNGGDATGWASGGGGGGAAGPNGDGGSGGLENTPNGTNTGGGGGGNGGGSAGGSVTTSSFGPGGNNYLGSGGGSTTGAPGTSGGGGAGALGGSGGAGGNGQDWDATHGSGGGGGGGQFASGAGGLYGGGSGGAGGASGNTSAAGAQGIIVITYNTEVDVIVAITGVQTTSSSLGSPSEACAAVTSISGVQSLGRVGSLSVIIDVEGAALGVQTPGHVGNLGFSGSISPSISGVSSSSGVGSPFVHLEHDAHVSLLVDVTSYYGSVQDATFDTDLQVDAVFIAKLVRFFECDIEVGAGFTGYVIHYATASVFIGSTAGFNADTSGFKVTQAPNELLGLPLDSLLKLTQASSELLGLPSSPALKLTQAVSELLQRPSEAEFILTQAVVEVLRQRIIIADLVSGAQIQSGFGLVEVVTGPSVLSNLPFPVGTGLIPTPLDENTITLRPIKGRIASRFSGSRIVEITGGLFSPLGPLNHFIPVLGTQQSGGPPYDDLRPFVANWNPVNLRPDSTDRFFTVRSGQEFRLDIVSQIVYSRSDLWWALALLNDIINPFERPNIGDKIRIPSLSRVMDTFGKVGA